ncbi:MAG: hypothetical protein OSB10_09470 [Planctomycetota bacterium]|nr:hypothetical protein [Planctomycetota bacterium]
MQRDSAIIAAAAGLLIWLLAQVLGGAAGSDTPLGVDRVEPTSAAGPSQRVTFETVAGVSDEVEILPIAKEGM